MTGRGSRLEVWDGLVNPRGHQGTLREVRDGSETLGEVIDGSREPQVGLGRVEQPLGRSWTGQGILG